MANSLEFSNFIRVLDLPICIKLVSFDVILLFTKVIVERVLVMEEVEQKALNHIQFYSSCLLEKICGWYLQSNESWLGWWPASLSNHLSISQSKESVMVNCLSWIVKLCTIVMAVWQPKFTGKQPTQTSIFHLTPIICYNTKMLFPKHSSTEQNRSVALTRIE